jgi:hypothetical protein
MAIINKVITIELNLNSYKKERVFLYISLIKYYDIILDIP